MILAIASTSLAAPLAFVCVAVACALLSLVVVARRWAFIGEGIGHSGFGGAGTAWLVSALWGVDADWLPTLGTIVGAIAAGVLIAILGRRERVSGDVAIGIVLVATVAWGFVGQQVYRALRHAEPASFETLLFGRPAEVTPTFALAAACVALAVVFALVAFGRPIVAYCLDPMLARTSGVRVELIEPLLIGLITLATIVGMQIVGSLLITALLVLPATIARSLSRRLSAVIGISVASAVFAAVVAWAIHARHAVVPVGPAIVLALIALFLIASIVGRFARPAA